MRIRFVPVLLAFLLVAAMPREAAADRLGFFRWWDSLSGPGPFTGWDYRVTLITHGIEKQEGTERKPGAEPPPAGVVTSKPAGPRTTFTDVSGLRTDRTQLYFSGGLEFAVMWTDSSDLQYEPGVTPPKVYAFPFMGTFDVGRRGIEGGVGIGWLRLSAPNAGNWHPIIEPRVTVYPFLLGTGSDRGERWRNSLEARFFITRVAGTIDPLDYGAIGEPEGGEWVPGISFSVNLAALLPWR